MNKLLVILGPTSTGKTDLGLLLAKKFDGELISADSRQVYKGLDIGTGKTPSGIYNLQFTIYKKEGYWEINGIKIWMYDVVSPKRQYTVADYVKNADKIIDDIRKRGKLPIVVGGTGLYLKALLYGLSNLSIPIDEKLRKTLERLTVKQLQEKIKKISSKKWESLNYSDQQNPRRLVRAIEIEEGIMNKGDLGSQGLVNEYDILKIGLTAKREILYQRSDERVIGRINQGMVEEVQRLRDEGISLKRFRQLGLEYGILADFLEGKIKTKEELIKILQFKIHGYIRRQQTWFKNPSVGSGYINWFDITSLKMPAKIESLVRKWYDSF